MIGFNWIVILQMKRSYNLFTITNDLEKDNLSRHFQQYRFKPHAFDHQTGVVGCDYRVISDFELIYFVDGISYVTFTTKEYECHKGDIILIPPFTKHKIQSSLDNPHDNYWIHFDIYPIYKQNHFTNILYNNSHDYLIKVANDTELIKLYHQLESEMKTKKPGYIAQFEILLKQILLHINRNLISTKKLTIDHNISSSIEEDIINQSVKYIENNIENNITIQDIYLNLHISESSLYKAFSKVMAITPNNFLQMQKLKRAEYLMITTNYSIKEISDILGFSNQYYFSSVFKKYYSMSPKQYIDAIMI